MLDDVDVDVPGSGCEIHARRGGRDGLDGVLKDKDTPAGPLYRTRLLLENLEAGRTCRCDSPGPTWSLAGGGGAGVQGGCGRGQGLTSAVPVNPSVPGSRSLCYYCVEGARRRQRHSEDEDTLQNPTDVARTERMPSRSASASH